MFHIGIATKHPPLPDPSELSDLGIDFIRQALSLDPTKRPTAAELLHHAWMKDLARSLEMMNSGEDELMWSNSAVGSSDGVVSVGDVLGSVGPSPNLQPTLSPSSNFVNLEVLLEVDEAE